MRPVVSAKVGMRSDTAAGVKDFSVEDELLPVTFPMFYGDIGFEDGLKKTQEECQKIMGQPRG